MKKSHGRLMVGSDRSVMKTAARLFGVVVVLLMFAPITHARLGESIEQCQKRFGPALSQVTADHGTWSNLEPVTQICLIFFNTQPSDSLFAKAGIMTFAKEDFNIAVAFWNGKAVCELYGHTNDLALTAAEVEIILNANSAGADWRLPEPLSDFKGDSFETLNSRLGSHVVKMGMKGAGQFYERSDNLAWCLCTHTSVLITDDKMKCEILRVVPYIEREAAMQKAREGAEKAKSLGF